VLAFALVAGGWTWRATEEFDPPIANLSDDATPNQAKPAVSSKPKVSKEQLRYGGKSFEEWSYTLEVDLSPEVRQKAFEALCVLGVNGYGKEAAKAILEWGREYDVYSAIDDERAVARSASSALGRLNEIAIPELLIELKTGNQFGPRLAAYTLRWGYQGPDSPLRARNVANYVPVSSSFVRGLLGYSMLSGNSPPGVQTGNGFGGGNQLPDMRSEPSGKAKGGKDPGKNKGTERSGKKGNGKGKGKGSDGRRGLASNSPVIADADRSKEIVAAVLAATFSDDPLVRFDSIAILAMMGPQASSAVPRLVELFADPNPTIKEAAIEAFAQIGGEPKVVIPGLEKLIAEEDLPDSQFSYLYLIIPMLEKLGKAAQPLVPSLVTLYYKTPASAKKLALVESLLILELDKSKMDPIIKDFLPLYFLERSKIGGRNEATQRILDYARKNNISLPPGVGGRGDTGRDEK
jgi:HEAT repeats